MRHLNTSLCIALASLALAACQSKEARVSSVDRTALSTMERVAVAANSCWFKSGDAAFKDYRLAPELNSFSGRPRILAVPKHSPEGRPLLVVQAEGNPARLDAFGPLLDGPNADRIRRDIIRWANGTKSC